MDSNPKQRGNKKDSAASAAPETDSVTKMGDVNTDMTERKTNTPSLEANTARNVFDTVSGWEKH